MLLVTEHIHLVEPAARFLTLCLLGTAVHPGLRAPARASPLPWLPPALRCKARPVPTAHPVPLPCCRSCFVPGYISCNNLFTVNAGYCLLGKGEGEGTVSFWKFACELLLPGTLCLAVPGFGGRVGWGWARWLLPSRHRLLSRKDARWGLHRGRRQCLDSRHPAHVSTPLPALTSPLLLPALALTQRTTSPSLPASACP